jgi:F-type H+-transporting ATPase subunit c
MNSVRFSKFGVVPMLTLVFAACASNAVFAQEAVLPASANLAAAHSVLHYFGAAIALGMIVIGAGLGIGRLAAAGAEGIARQPAATTQITGAINLPLFLLEGVAILAEVFALLIILTK